MKKYKCLVCDWIYDEEKGSPKEGIKAGTKWNDVPEDWVCPDCGATKDQFDMVEI
jgi:rubredoxin